jgi:hypothetical protein
MEDIYDGNIIHAWEDEGMIFLSFPWVTIYIPCEEWGQIVTDLRELVLAVRETEVQELKREIDERKN